MENVQAITIIPMTVSDVQNGCYLLKSPQNTTYKLPVGSVEMKNGTLFKLDATTYWQLIVPTHEDEPRDELDKPETWPEKIIENEAELETSGKTEYEVEEIIIMGTEKVVADMMTMFTDALRVMEQNRVASEERLMKMMLEQQNRGTTIQTVPDFSKSVETFDGDCESRAAIEWLEKINVTPEIHSWSQRMLLGDSQGTILWERPENGMMPIARKSKHGPTSLPI
ncbi:hypothetical protein TcasGA2_TC011573 [Tribolium castaneum]|uniref:Uncharacterized protein n=1 Tax=Tribolium castaneum TaxID=7070 RepID=D7EKX3_TRICA|nr:hypothetical protein TcasGA2_TC011573 [Tribolium castaneum]